MKSITKQFANNVGSGLLAQVVFSAVGIFLLPYALPRLGREAYGIFELASSATFFFNFLQAGMGSTVVRFSSKAIVAGDATSLRKISSTALLIMGVMGIIGAISIIVLIPVFLRFYGISNSLQRETTILLMCMSASFLVNMIFIALNGLVMGANRHDISNGVEIVANLMRLVLVICSFELIRPSLALFGGCLLLSQLFRLVALWGLSSKYCSTPFSFSINAVTRDMLRSMGGFSMMMFVNSLSYFFVMQSPSLILGKTLGIEYVALLAPARLIGNSLSMILMKISAPLTPLSSRIQAEGKPEDMSKWTTSVASIVSWIGFGLLIPFAVSGESIMRIWMGGGLVDTWQIVVLYSIGAVVSQVGGVLHYMALGGGDMRAAVASQCVLALLIPLGIIWGTVFNNWGLLSVMSYLLACRILRNVFYLTIVYSKEFGYRVISFLSSVYLKPAMCFAIAGTVGLCIRNVPGGEIIKTLWTLSGAGLTFFLLSYMFLSDDIRGRLVRFLRNPKLSR